jgi:hypothetical protein
MGKVTGGAHEKGFEFAKGGKGKMFGPGHANAMEAEISAKKTQESGKGGKFAVGGKGKMFGAGSARTMEPGVTAKSNQ